MLCVLVAFLTTMTHVTSPPQWEMPTHQPELDSQEEAEIAEHKS